MSTFVTLLVLGGLGVFISYIRVVAASQDRDLERRRQEARADFRGTLFDSEDPRFRLSGATATVVREEEDFNPRHPAESFTLTIFARNEHGEYFMFKSTTPRPYVKHVEHRIAKVVLKDAYVPPQAQG